MFGFSEGLFGIKVLSFSVGCFVVLLQSNYIVTITTK